MWKHSVEDHLARGDNSLNLKNCLLNFLQLTKVATRFNVWDLHLWVRTITNQRPSGGWSDSVGMHFFRVFVVVVVVVL